MGEWYMRTSPGVHYSRVWPLHLLAMMIPENWCWSLLSWPWPVLLEWVLRIQALDLSLQTLSRHFWERDEARVSHPSRCWEGAPCKDQKVLPFSASANGLLDSLFALPNVFKESKDVLPFLQSTWATQEVWRMAWCGWNSAKECITCRSPSASFAAQLPSGWYL